MGKSPLALGGGVHVWVAVALILCATGVAALTSEPPKWVIPPGNEAALTAMLGYGAALVDGCRLDDVSVLFDHVVATYSCPGSQVSVTLSHLEVPSSTDSIRTEAFALSVSNHSLVAARLRDQVAELVRAGEDPALWKLALHSDRESHSPEDPDSSVAEEMRRGASESDRRLLQTAGRSGWSFERRDWIGAPWDAFWLSLVLPVLAILLFLRQRHGSFPSFTSASSALAWVLPTLLFGVALYASGRVVLWAICATLMAGRSHAVLRTLVFGSLFVVALAGAVAAVFLWHRARPRAPATVAAISIAALLVVVSYLVGLNQVEHSDTWFGSVRVWSAGAHVPELNPARPKDPYAINSHGFRGPEWMQEPSPDSIRIILIGDSFVFGSGVDWEDTLGVSLEAELRERCPERRFEVLNLGVPGNNLASHGAILAESTRSLMPNAVVLCLTLPNDLSQFDIQNQAVDEMSPSITSVLRWAGGPTFSGWVWGRRELAVELGPRELEVAHHEVARIAEALRERAMPRLLVFSFFPTDASVVEAFSRLPGVIWVDPANERPEYFIPGDGHPTGAGNRASAARIAEVVSNLELVPDRRTAPPPH